MVQEEITLEALEAQPKDTYLLVDIRDEAAFQFGHMDGAIHIPANELPERHAELPKDRLLVIYCRSGIISEDAAAELREDGFSAVNLVGGYVQWLQRKIRRETTGEKAAEIEQSLRKKFHRVIFSRFAKAVNTYDLIQPNDRIAVCISGGKDSMLMAKLFQELQRHGKFPFELVFLVMDPGYSPENRAIIESNAKLLQIPITVFETNIFNSVYNVENNPCYLCARMRRGYLYSKAKELGCNKIALGHHFDDVIETILMGMLYGGQVQTMMPKLHSIHFEGMELIRPLYLIREGDIKHWRDYNSLHFIQCACRFTDTCTTCRPNGESASKRMEIKHMIAEMKKVNPYVETNIFRSIENVNLDTVVAYKKNGVKHSFLEDYESC